MKKILMNAAERFVTKLLSYDVTPPASNKSEVFEWCEKSFIAGAKSEEAKAYWFNEFKKGFGEILEREVEAKPQSLAEEFKSLFPLKGNITQDIINNAKIYNNKSCIGALTLMEALPEKFKEFRSWGTISGGIQIGGETIEVTTIEGVHMMNVNKPMEVTFKIY